MPCTPGLCPAPGVILAAAGTVAWMPSSLTVRVVGSLGRPPQTKFTFQFSTPRFPDKNPVSLLALTHLLPCTDRGLLGVCLYGREEEGHRG